MKVRQDAWTEENDLLLAETVLRHVREGSTQLNAFEEVGDHLDRTSAACGFRWNSVVRQQYEQALSLSRKQRKQRQRLLGIDQGGKKKILYQPTYVQDFETYAQDVDTSIVTMLDNEKGSKGISEANVFTQGKDVNLDEVILFLESYRKMDSNQVALRAENDRLTLELTEQRRKNEELEKRLGSIQVSSTSMQEDYETLINIMNKARKLVMIEEDDRSPTKFKMDKNGNLEKIAE